jgi:DNA-binding response OmpR family regulator
MRTDVLIVEDDEDIRADLAAILRIKGFHVHGAANGREALDLLRAKPSAPPCVIVLDLMMPVMNGWELRAALKADARLAPVPVIIMSGAGRIEDNSPSLDAAAILVKPFELARLLELVGRYCGRHEHSAAPR